jgi:micrococcal nuclease
MWEEVKLDVDDKKQYDPHYRILAVVYVNDTNLNEILVKEGYAEVMYIPPSEFDSREWGGCLYGIKNTLQLPN